MLSRIRLGFVGCGAVAISHMKAIAPMKNVEIAAFCSPGTEKAAARIAEWRTLRPNASPSSYTDVSTMLSDAGIDAVYILLPPFAHGPAERTCLRHEKPFFVEKPIGLDLGICREISAEVAKKGLITSVGYMNRYRASVQRAREILVKDPPILVLGGWIGGSPKTKPGDTTASSWWVQMDKSGGQIVEQCTHTFDLVRFLCGEAVEVCAYAARGFNKGIHNYSIDDASVVNMKLASGGVVNLNSCCASDGGGGGITLTVHAHDTYIGFNGWEHSVKIRRKGAEVEEIKGEDDIFVIEDRAFLDAVGSDKVDGILSSYGDATRTLQLTLAANESIDRGRPVAI